MKEHKQIVEFKLIDGSSFEKEYGSSYNCTAIDQFLYYLGEYKRDGYIRLQNQVVPFHSVVKIVYK